MPNAFFRRLCEYCRGLYPTEDVKEMKIIKAISAVLIIALFFGMSIIPIGTSIQNDSNPLETPIIYFQPKIKTFYRGIVSDWRVDGDYIIAHAVFVQTRDPDSGNVYWLKDQQIKVDEYMSHIWFGILLIGWGDSL